MSDQTSTTQTNGTNAPACCDAVILQTCCGAEHKPGCCGPETAPKVCGCGTPPAKTPQARSSV